MTLNRPERSADSPGRAWIAALPPQLAKQARLLSALLAAAEADEQWEALELSCSMASGRADDLSDLDVGLWHRSGAATLSTHVDTLVRRLGEVVEVNAQSWDGMARWWVQYVDGTQLDLVMGAADDRGAKAPGAVMLLDRTGRFQKEFTPSVLHPKPDEPGQWLLDGWEALSNTAKYLKRGSLLEAAEQLQRARHRVCQLWAAGEGVDYPTFGLTSLLDDDGAQLPPDLAATYPVVSPVPMAHAAEALARLLRQAGHRGDLNLDTPLADYVTGQLLRVTLRGADRGPGL